MASQDLLSCGDAADCHELAVERSVGLDDAHEGHTGRRQPVRDGSKCAFVGDGQADRVRAAREVSRTALAGRVDYVCGLDTSHQVRPDNHIVVEFLGDQRVGVIARSSR